MDFYVIVPRYYTHLVKDETHFLVIAQHLDLWPEYYDFFVKKGEEPDTKIILDNGIIEYGKPIEMSVMFKLAEIIGARELVIPDEWKDGGATVAKAFDFVDAIEDNYEINTWKLMGVPHGRTIEEYINCKRVLAREVDTIGLAYREWQDGTGIVRTFFTHFMRDHGTSLHMLGLWNTNELSKCHPKVRSVDTSLPFRAAQKGTAIYLGYTNTERFDFEMKLTETQEQRAKYNIKYLKGLCVAPKDNTFTKEWRKQYGI